MSKKLVMRFSAAVLVLVLLVGGYYAIKTEDRMDLTKADDRYTVEKNVGFSPVSGEVYLKSSGVVDPTVFFKVKATDEEANRRLADASEVPPFSPPRNAPGWWRAEKSHPIKYFKTKAKWPCLFMLDAQGGWLYGTVEYE